MVVRLCKVEGGHPCRKEDEPQASGGKDIRELDGEKTRHAERARAATMEILQYALDKGMFGEPFSYRYTCEGGLSKDRYKLCAVPTKAFLKDAIKILEKAKFKEDVNPSHRDTFAYVYPTDKKYTIYLCEAFWGAPMFLSKDSQPGTLIHEVSHFLGTEDITYEHLYIEVDLFQPGNVIIGKRVLYEPLKKSKSESIAEEQTFMTMNANSLEYEFETIVNHQPSYDSRTRKYPCCGETQENSLCLNRARGHYYLYDRFQRRSVKRDL